MGGFVAFIVIIALLGFVAYHTIKVVRQSEVYIIERLGKFHKIADAGLTIIIPFIDKVRSVVSLKQQTMEIPPQSVITSDNVTITIDTVVLYKIIEPAKAVYEIQSLRKGIEYLAITTIRDIVGKMELDETFSSRDMINDRLRIILSEATDQWGCKVDRVEIKDITPPADIRDAMEKQMNAERNKRALILEAEGKRQSEVYIIERLGKFHKVADAGLTIIVPFFDHVRSVVSLKQQTMDIPPQGVITKDNVTITIDTVVFYQITDPAKAVYEIQSLKKGIEYLAITTIRDIVGKMDLDATFSSRDGINSELRVILDEATDRWGCKIDRVEIKDITPPADIRDAMEKQMNAERNKRALILEAEAQKQSAVTIAEGKKQAAILEAEADREAKIRRAAGEAQAIKAVAEAKAKEIQLVYDAIKDSNPDEKLVQLKSLEALQEVAKGDANKIFIPFEATSALSSIGALKDVVTDNVKKSAKSKHAKTSNVPDSTENTNTNNVSNNDVTNNQ